MCDLDTAKIGAVAIGYADLRLGKSVDNYSFSVEIAVGVNGKIEYTNFRH